MSPRLSLFLKTALPCLVASLLIDISAEADVLSPLWKVHGANQLKYRQRGDQFGPLSNWLDLTYPSEYFFGDFEVGVRYQVYETSDLGADFGAISQRYLEFEKGQVRARLGSYYVTFGRGMALRLFENRALRRDDFLDGAILRAYFDRFDLTLVRGRSELGEKAGSDLIWGGDLEVRPLDDLTVGGNFVLADLAYGGRTARRIRLPGVRLGLSLDHLDLYGEYAEIERGSGSVSPEGRGVYLSADFYGSRFSLSAEYKNYEEFDFRYSTPPALNPGALGESPEQTLTAPSGAR